MNKIGLQYTKDSLEPGCYRIYHTSVLPENLLSDKVYLDTDLYEIVELDSANFPQSLIDHLETNNTYHIVIEKL
jgi:hypothetical protein